MNITLNEKNTTIIMIILGLITLLFPVVSTQTIGVFCGIVVLLIAIALLISGLAQLAISRLFGLLSIILSVACIFFAHQLMFNPEVVSSLISFIIYLVGFLLIVIGILAFITGKLFNPFSLIGITTILFGILTIIVGIFVDNPEVLGTIVGIWLIVSGLLSLFSDKNKNYIDI